MRSTVSSVRNFSQYSLCTSFYLNTNSRTKTGSNRNAGPITELFEWASTPGSRLVLLGMANGVNMIEEYLPGLRAMKCNPERLVFSLQFGTTGDNHSAASCRNGRTYHTTRISRSHTSQKHHSILCQESRFHLWRCQKGFGRMS